MIRIFFILWTLLFLSGCDSSSERDERMDINHEEELKSYCVGRHIVDVPVSFSHSSIATGIFKNSGAGGQDSSFNVVATENMSVERFDNEMRRRQAELAGSERDVDVLRVAERLNDKSMLFRVQNIDDAYTSEISVLRDDVMITARLDSFDNEYSKADDALKYFLSRFAKRDDKKPLGEGFCLGSVKIIGDFQTEYGDYSFRDDLGNHLGIMIDTFSPAEDAGLLSRVQGPNSLLTIFSVDHTVLRARELTVAGMRAQEWLAWANLSDQDDIRTHKFELQTIRPQPGKFKPEISLTLTSGLPDNDGTRVKNSMSDKKIVSLWDRIVASIRPANL